MLGECKRHVLSNGLRIVGVENSALHSFVCSVYARVGSRFDPSELTGLSHFLEHMILQGSESFPTSAAIMRSMEELGGLVDAGTYPEYINVVFGVHRKHWPRALEIAGDVLLHPLFSKDEIEQEKRIVSQEISQHRDKAGHNISVSELSHALLFNGDVSEAGTRGSRAILNRFDRPTVEGHYRKFFVPRNMVVCFAGAFDFGEVLSKVERSFGAMEGGSPLPGGPAPSPAANTRARALYRTTEALPLAEVMLSHRAYALGDNRFDGVRAVSHVLGGGLSSRLFTRVREELGLVYDVESHLQGYSDTGTLDVFLTVSVDNLVRAVEAALEVVRQGQAQGFLAEELERYKEASRCGMDMLCDDASHLADWFGRQELLLGADHVLTPGQYVRRQEALTVDALNAIGRETLAEGHGTFFAIGPFGETEQTALQRLIPADEIKVTQEPPA